MFREHYRRFSPFSLSFFFSPLFRWIRWIELRRQVPGELEAFPAKASYQPDRPFLFFPFFLSFFFPPPPASGAFASSSTINPQLRYEDGWQTIFERLVGFPPLFPFPFFSFFSLTATFFFLSAPFSSPSKMRRRQLKLAHAYWLLFLFFVFPFPEAFPFFSLPSPYGCKCQWHLERGK